MIGTGATRPDEGKYSLALLRQKWGAAFSDNLQEVHKYLRQHYSSKEIDHFFTQPNDNGYLKGNDPAVILDVFYTMRRGEVYLLT